TTSASVPIRLRRARRGAGAQSRLAGRPLLAFVRVRVLRILVDGLQRLDRPAPVAVDDRCYVDILAQELVRPEADRTARRRPADGSERLAECRLISKLALGSFERGLQEINKIVALRRIERGRAAEPLSERCNEPDILVVFQIGGPVRGGQHAPDAAD